MGANGISDLSTKQAKQAGKLDIAEAKRQGKTVALDGTITGSLDNTKEYYRPLNMLDINLLPTKYSGNTLADNINTAGLVQGRPWQSNIVTADLVMHLDAGDVDSYSGSGTAVNDMTDNNLDAVLVGGVGFTDYYWTLDGTDDYIRSANLYSTIGNPDTFSAGAWVYPTAAGVVLQVAGTPTPGQTYFFSALEFVGAGSPVPNFGLWNGAGTTKDTGSALSYNTWYHIVQTYNAGTNTMKGYINGAEVASATVIFDSPHDDGLTVHHLLWGAGSVTNMGDGTYYNGRMSEIRVYDRALSAADVLDNFNATRSRYLSD